jgi:hypothetical protein
MAGNQSPIFSRVGDVQGGVIMQNAVASTGSGYTGTDANTYTIYTADPTNGGFVQRIRLKANANTPANVVRFWMCNANGNYATTTTAPTTPTATISATSGVMTPATYYMKVQAIDAFGQPGPWSAEVSNTVPATGNNIVWGWSAPSPATQGVSTYRLAIGLAANQDQFVIANVTGTSYTQNTTFWTGQLGNQVGQFYGYVTNSSASFTNSLLLNTTLIGEVSIPAFTASNTSATADIDYPLNIAVPPGYRIIAGLGNTAGANGIFATAIAGKY